MAGEEKNTKTISKNNTGFPGYLDFDQLRKNSIEYIGKLSGQVWTDHNVHDPGITILEVLCYAILDLGYRTNLPVEDILSRNPEETGADTNFFTPGQILTCNPLTITDYRKLLVDIKDVKNAWLVPADDEKDRCRSRIGGVQGQDDGVYLNGLYHVYIELENYPGDNDKTPLDEFGKSVLENVKSVLMAHRNFCEDFIDITILCRLPLGVCVSIDLEDNADAEAVYISIAEQLNAFFSPAPKFYTLQQMLDKNISIEDIFAGRPYSASSYGFTDTKELEAIQLNKEIHLSDVYNVLFNITGVKKVTALQLRTCTPNGGSKMYSGWKFAIPENYIPSFSAKCSGFEFTRNGLPVSVDTKKFETLFELGFSHNGKVQYSLPSPYLDLAIPQGTYSDELDDYYSIQNDFPEVYGIGEGDLPANASIARQARALQLKGYLMFFDQLLANYLSQLKNIRSLFALSAPANKKDRRTYFLNNIDTVPDMERLLRFPPGSSGIGSQGATLVLPVSAADWESLETANGNLQDVIATLQPYTFASRNAANSAIMIVQTDLLSEGAATITILQGADESWYYGISSSIPDYILVSKKTFATQLDAAQHAASVQYIGVHNDNYNVFTANGSTYSFDIAFNVTSYTGYLELMEEDEVLYSSRRKDFLNHLLSRFAEKFTDFALLSWQDAQAIPAVENFLTSYDDLSRNRGKAYDYRVNGWNAANVSGFEKKVKALSGLPGDKATLCHFVVEPCEDYYNVRIKAGEEVILTTPEKFDAPSEAEAAAGAMIKAMKKVANYRADYIGHEKTYELRLNYGRTVPAVYPYAFKNSNHAEQLAGYFVRSFRDMPDEHDVAVNDYVWRADIMNHNNELIAYSIDVREHEEEIKALEPALLKKISDPKVWTYVHPEKPALKAPKKAAAATLVNTEAFKVDINDTLVGKPGKFTYGLLDQEHNFKITPVGEFDNAKTAGEHSMAVLSAAADRNNWKAVPDEQTKQYAIQIVKDDKPEAVLVTQYADAEQAEAQIDELHKRVHRHCYHVCESKHPKTWKFYYTLGYEENDTWRFESEASYTGHEEAEKMSAEFYKAIPELKVKISNKEVFLQAGKKAPAMRLSHSEGQPVPDEATINRLVTRQLNIREAVDDVDEQKLSQFVTPDRQTEQPGFLYRLVNKDRIPARSLNVVDLKNDPRLFKRKLAAEYKNQQWAPMICLGGNDVLFERMDEQGITRYHYQVRFRNLPFVDGFELSLFTSVMGYDSREEAEAAFNQNYLHLLGHAAKEQSYGTLISETPLYLPQQGKTGNTEAIAFIGEEALSLFKKKYGAQWKQEMAKLSEAYPVKVVRYGSKEFADLFCAQPIDEEAGCRAAAKAGWKYYFTFSLYNVPAGFTDPKWISTGYFDTPEAALQEFKYFNRLLGYAGNWFIDCDTCSVNNTANIRYYIYEVLAESIDCYSSREEAWGPTGVEAFICAVQSGKGIQRYARKTDCCYSFYINCGDAVVEHPCTYDSPEQRDKAMNELYNGYKQMVEKNAYRLEEEGNSLVISNSRGVPVGRISFSKDRKENICDVLTGAVEAVQSNKSDWSEQNGRYVLLDAGKKPVIYAHEKIEKITLKAWQYMIEDWACYFPVTRTKTGTITTKDATGQTIEEDIYKYCIEIKIPGFSSCGEGAEEPCTCNSPEPAPDPHCYIAWKSPCCFTTCAEVSLALAVINKLLLEFRFYHPTFDCSCGSYGIALHPDAMLRNIRLEDGVRNEQPATAPATGMPRLSSMAFAYDVRETGGILVNPVPIRSSLGQVIARNPQCYQTPDEVCAATDTLVRLVNTGGLHVVEHILLRAKCDTDCSCKERQVYCYDHRNCNYPKYKVDNDDPCNTKEDIPFLPGSDPYSFIATVVLPAWPSVFRDASKRMQAEHIIYSEAPAHVLLRIVWLRPMDFCRFEAYLKEWRRWMADARSCNTAFSVCNFLHLLFHTSYTCLPDCEICGACSDLGAPATNSCAADRTINTDEYKKRLEEVRQRMEEITKELQNTAHPQYMLQGLQAEFNSLQKEKKQLERDLVTEEQFAFLNLVNGIFCMNDYLCGDNRIVVAGDFKRELSVQPELIATPAAVQPEKVKTIARETPKKTTPVAEKKKTPAKPVAEEKPKAEIKKAEEKPAAETKRPGLPIGPKEKAHFVNSRHKKYMSLATGVLEHSGENELAVKTKAFVQSTDPAVAKLEALVKEIIQNKKPAGKGAKPLNRNQSLDLLQAAVCHYLDKISFNGKEAEKFKALQPAISAMQKAKTDVQALYNYWDAAGISVYEPELDTDMIKHLFTGNKK